MAILLHETGSLLLFGLDTDGREQPTANSLDMCPLVPTIVDIRAWSAAVQGSTLYDTQPICCGIMNHALKCYGTSSTKDFRTPSGAPLFISLGLTPSSTILPVDLAVADGIMCVLFNDGSVGCKTEMDPQLDFSQKLIIPGNRKVVQLTVNAEQPYDSESSITVFADLLLSDGTWIGWGFSDLSSPCNPFNLTNNDLSSIVPILDNPYFGFNTTGLEVVYICMTRQRCALIHNTTAEALGLMDEAYFIVCLDLFFCSITTTPIPLSQYGGARPIQFTCGLITSVLFDSGLVKAVDYNYHVDGITTATKLVGALDATCALLANRSVVCYGYFFNHLVLQMPLQQPELQRTGFTEALNIWGGTGHSVLIQTPLAMLVFTAGTGWSSGGWQTLAPFSLSSIRLDVIADYSYTYSRFGFSTTSPQHFQLAIIPLTLCSDGRYDPDCVCAPRGTYLSQIDASEPIPCPIGTYSAELGRRDCLPCPARHFQASVGTTECVPCAPGSAQSLAGQSECTQCPPGHYADQSAMAACIPCATNTFASSSGAVLCQPCPAGQYAVSTASHACVSCPPCEPGFQPIGRGDGAGCGQYEQCGANTFSTQGLNCSVCSNGYRAAAGASFCCPQCPPSTYRLAVLQPGTCDACVPCAADSYSAGMDVDTCTKCPQGTWTNGTTGNVACLPCLDCEPGQYATRGDDTHACPTCVPCEPNTFSNTTNAPNCTACESNYYAPLGATECCPICSRGLYASKGNGTERCPVCIKCAVNTISSVENAPSCTSCDSGEFSLDGVTCHPCLNGYMCTGPHPNYLKNNYWRAAVRHSDRSDRSSRDTVRYEKLNQSVWDSALGEVVACWKADACRGDDVITHCANGYRGVLCDVCDNGYFSTMDSCTQCPSRSVSIALLVVGVVIVLAILTFLTFRSVVGHADGRSIKLKIAINYVQVLASLGGFTVRWSKTMQGFFGVASSSGNAGFDQLLSAECSLKDAGVDYYTTLAFYLSLPLVATVLCVAVFVVVWLILRVVRPTTRPHVDRWARMCAAAVLFLLFYLYLPVTTRALAVFNCHRVDNVPYLVADMSVECDTAEHNRYKIAAAIVLAVFTGGEPVLFFKLLWTYRHDIVQAQKDVVMFRFLYQGYGAHAYWWELVVMLRKVVVAVLVVFLAREPFYQVYAGMWLISVALAGTVLWRPYAPNRPGRKAREAQQSVERRAHDSVVHQWIEVSTLLALWITLVGGLLYWRDVGEDGETALTVLLIFVNVAVIAGIVIVGIATDRQLKNVAGKLRKRIQMRKSATIRTETELVAL